MYPALCFTKDTCEITEAKETLQNTLSEESFAIIAGQAELKFKIVEFFQNLATHHAT